MAKPNSDPTSTSRDQTNWRERYLSSLEELEHNQRQHQQLVALLTRAVNRVALAAQGQDERLDGQLMRVRELLRKGDSTLKELSDALEVLELQIQRLDETRPKWMKAALAGFRTLSEQLRRHRADDPQLAQRIKQFEKMLKVRAARLDEWPALVAEVAELQRGVLGSTHAESAKAGGFWQRWFGRQPPSEEIAPRAVVVEPLPATVAGVASAAATIRELPERVAQEHPPESTEDEPPFTRISRPICAVLDELLSQIDPPTSAKDTYAAAREQVDRGLNWYELVPTLEDVCIVVMATIDRDQHEFEDFLNQLNDRLRQADEVIHHSRASEAERQQAGLALTASVRASVSDIQAHVAKATELAQLKAQVAGRLESIVGAIDQFQVSETSRELTLTEQLNGLVDRVRAMEEASQTAEARIEEQRKLALRDVLTQLPNREAYDQRSQQEFERWRRYRRPLSLAVCDIDYFKKINDSYGHLAGDKVLRIIAKTLRHRLRKTDFIARYGGEEFVILMPETTAEQAMATLDKVREAVASCPFHFREQRVSITLSFGVTEFGDAEQPEQVFERADQCLYRAKTAGRNRCELAAVTTAPGVYR